jgi:hypothetical protein
LWTIRIGGILMAVFTVVRNGYDQGTAYYVDDELYTWVHCNDEHEKEDILLSVIERGDIHKVEQLDLDDFFEDHYDEFDYPDSLKELKKITNMS